MSNSVPTSNFIRRPLEAHLAAPLRLLAAGLPVQHHLALRDVTWGGIACPSIERIEITESGELSLEAQPPNEAAIVEEPADWTPQVFTGWVHDRATLAIDKGVSYDIQSHYGAKGNTIIAARLRGWAWQVDDPKDANVRLWAAPLLFANWQTPVALWWPTGNVRLCSGEAVRRGWRFETSRGPVFLIPDEDRRQWTIAFGIPTGSRPEPEHVKRILSVIGFAFGEPLKVGVFRSVHDEAIGGGFARFDLADLRCTSSQPPALPMGIEPVWVVEFVERALRFLIEQPNAPLLRALHLYFAAVDGFIESQFLHAWIATETLASWALENKRLRNSGQLRIADHDAWLDWVRAHEAEIKSHAVPGREQQLVDRVRSSENDRPTPVQRVFRGEGIEWTDEMNHVEKTRHRVVHEGSSLGGQSREWDRDRARIGLAKTLLTAVIAKLIGYDGPIADRSKTCFDLAGKYEPSWWTAAPAGQTVIYEGRGGRSSADRQLLDGRRIDLLELTDEPRAAFADVCIG